MCERSTTAAARWPDQPQPISAPPDQAAAVRPVCDRCHVVADEQDPNTFYAIWLDTLTGFLDGSGRSPFWFTKTTDGARTWEPARIIERIDQLPNVFPRQSFRNLSLPIIAAGPRSELYVTYADYNPAPYAAADEDGMQADINFCARSTVARRGASRRRQQGRRNADQFQPYVRVTRARPGERVVLRPPLRPARPAEPPG